MWPSAVSEIHQQWKTSVSLNVWQSSLLTLSADDGKEPQVWVNASSTACYLGPSARAEHTHTGLNTASVDTRNVFLPYFCWCVRTAKVKHLSLFSLKLYICRTSLNSVITHTALLLQSMAMKSVIDMADNHCVYVWCGIDVLHQFSAIFFYWHSSNNSCLKVLYGKVNSI